jgi:hypothetical protein
MRLNKDFIFKHIKDTKYPLWALYLVQNYRRVPLAFYNGDDFTDDEKTEGKTEKSCIRLASTLQDFPADAVLSIDLKNAKTANGSGILGPFEFVNMSKDDADNQQPQQAPQFAGFGFAQPPAGWVSEQVLNAKLDEMRAENERKINELIFKQRERDFEERMARERKELDELRRELRDEKKKYDSNTGKVAQTLAGAAKIVIGDLFPGLGIDKTEAAAQLAGANQPELPETTQPAQPSPSATTDPKYKAIERLAEMLYKSENVTEAQVANLTKGIEAELAKQHEPEKKEVQNA